MTGRGAAASCRDEAARALRLFNASALVRTNARASATPDCLSLLLDLVNHGARLQWYEKTAISARNGAITGVCPGQALEALRGDADPAGSIDIVAASLEMRADTVLSTGFWPSDGIFGRLRRTALCR